tara:strand:+ start:347 stop:559 length:213 start_codon:yes stop_codon:yes gene_type:complete
MKTGDLVRLSDEGVLPPDPTIGLVVDMDALFVKFANRIARRKFVGVLWVDGNGHIDYERKEWLEVVNETG